MEMTLYGITAEMKAVMDAMTIDEETGEAFFDEQAMERLETALDVKAESVAIVVKNLEAAAKAIGEEAKRLQARKKAADNAAKRLREYAIRCVEQTGRVETPRAVLSVRSTQAVDVFDLDALPEQFIRIKREADKTAIKAAIHAGEEVPGACIVINKSLNVR